VDKSRIVKLTFLGDVMCKAQMLPAYQKEDGTYNFESIFEGMKAYFSMSNFVLANLETPISENNQNLTEARWCFNSPYEFAEAAYKAGINFVATANNHCLDRGIEGINSTVRSLNKINIYHTGIYSNRKQPPLIVEVGGLKIGLMSYTYGTNAFSNHQYLKLSELWRVNLFQRQELSNCLTRWCYYNKGTFVSRCYYKFLKLMKSRNAVCQPFERKESSVYERHKLIRDIRQMKRKAPDLIVMYMHSGGQYNSEATRGTKELTEYLIKNGVNIVAGSHEHVVHGGDFSKIKEKKLITYSLGNFDGVAGVYDEPFDKMAEYSVAWNVYVKCEKGNIQFSKTSFSVLKTIPISGQHCVWGEVKTVPVFELINNEKDLNKKNKLWSDMKKIAYCFAGMDIQELGLQKEYVILI
jgi:poly-gamma-glutamate synthesis protein (capsule biosynthesis protein)